MIKLNWWFYLFSPSNISWILPQKFHLFFGVSRMPHTTGNKSILAFEILRWHNSIDKIRVKYFLYELILKTLTYSATFVLVQFHSVQVSSVYLVQPLPWMGLPANKFAYFSSTLPYRIDYCPENCIVNVKQISIVMNRFSSALVKWDGSIISIITTFLGVLELFLTVALFFGNRIFK